MAKQTGQLQFTGRLGNLIGYKRNGEYFVRSMPAEVHQTPATLKAANKFGVSSSKCALIRKALGAHLDVKGDKSRVSRLNQRWIKSGIHGLKGYKFNQYTGLDTFFGKTPTLSEDNILRVPAQALPELPKATRLEVKLIAVKIDFDTKRTTGSASKSLTIDLSKPFQGFDLDASVKGKGTLIVVLQIMIYQGDVLTLDRRYKAADIIAVIPQRVQQTVIKQGNKVVKALKPEKQIHVPAKTKIPSPLLIVAEQLE